MGVFLSDAPAMDTPAHLHQSIVSPSGDRVVARRGFLDDHGSDDEGVLLELFAGLEDVLRVLRRGLLTQLGIIAPQQGGDTVFLGRYLFVDVFLNSEEVKEKRWKKVVVKWNGVMRS